MSSRLRSTLREGKEKEDASEVAPRRTPVGQRRVGGRLLIFGMRGHIFRSEDLGESWQEIESGVEQSLQSGIQLQDGRIVLVGLGGIILSSRDGGRSFTSTAEPDRTGIASVAQGSSGQVLLFGERGVKTPVAIPE